MVGGETTSGTEAFLLPWVSVAGVYLHSGGQRGFRYTEVGDQEARSGAREKGSVWCTRLAVGCYIGTSRESLPRQLPTGRWSLLLLLLTLGDAN